MNDEKILDGKHVIVTGGSVGIGRVTVEGCLAAGARVTFCARNERELAAAAGDLGRRFAGAVQTQRADVSQPAEVEALFDAAVRRFGTIGAVIHAAAIQGPIGAITMIDPAEWRAAIDVDLFGAFLVTRAACIRMQERGGRIVLFSGGGASYPFPNYTAYAASKVGVVRLCETVAVEMAAEGIEINCVAPGFVATRMQQETLRAGVAAGEAYFRQTKDAVEKGGGVSPEVGASCAVFLASDRAAGITGKLVSAVHDGYRAWPEHLDELRAGDLFTLRRVLPKERGLNWQ